MIINNDNEYQEALAKLEELMDGLMKYEEENYPIGGNDG